MSAKSVLHMKHSQIIRFFFQIFVNMKKFAEDTFKAQFGDLKSSITDKLGLASKVTVPYNSNLFETMKPLDVLHAFVESY